MDDNRQQRHFVRCGKTHFCHGNACTIKLIKLEHPIGISQIYIYYVSYAHVEEEIILYYILNTSREFDIYTKLLSFLS